MEYTTRPTAYIVEAYNGRKWKRYAIPYEEHLTEVIEEALEWFPKVRYKQNHTGNFWLYAYAEEETK